MSVLSLTAIIYSSDVITNRTTDFYNASALNIKETEQRDDKSVDNNSINTEISRKSEKKETKKNKNITNVKVPARKNTKEIKKRKVANLNHIMKKEVKRQESNQQNILTGYATAYTARPGKRMSNGKIPIAGVHCAMHPKYKGKRVEVTTNGRVYNLEVGDTGGAVQKGDAIVDIFMSSEKECINFGRRKAKVRILN